jgi:hypothetical protein
MDGYYYDDGYPPGGYDYPGEYEGYYPEDYPGDPRLYQGPHQRQVH